MFEKLSNAMKGNQNARKNKSPFRTSAINSALTVAAGSTASIAKSLRDNRDAIKSLGIATRMGKTGANAAAAERIRKSMGGVLHSAVKVAAKQGAAKSLPVALGVGAGTFVASKAKSIAKRRNTPMAKIRRLLK